MNRRSNGLQCNFILLTETCSDDGAIKKKGKNAEGPPGQRGAGVEEQEIPRNSVDGPRQRMWPHPRVALLNLAPTVTSNWGVLLSNEHGRWTVCNPILSIRYPGN